MSPNPFAALRARLSRSHCLLALSALALCLVAPARAADDPKSKPALEALLTDAKSLGDEQLKLRQKGDKSYFIIDEALMSKRFLLCADLHAGPANAGFLSTTMGPCWVARFRIFTNGAEPLAQLLAQSSRAQADDDSVKRQSDLSYSEAILTQAPLASAQGATGAAVDAQVFFGLSDIAGWGSALERGLKAPYTYDARTSRLARISQDKNSALIELESHFFIARANALQKTPASADTRSLLTRQWLRMHALDRPSFPARVPHPMAGYFTTQQERSAAYSSTGRIERANRWRIEPTDPSLPISPAKEPLVVWVDPSVPPLWREAVEQGALMWNEAFEAIGISGAIQTRLVNTSDPAWGLGARVFAQWFRSTEDNYALGPSRANPFTGEILEARVLIPDGFSLGARSKARSQGVLGERGKEARSPAHAAHEHSDDEICDVAQELGTLAAQATAALDPDASEETVRAYVHAYVRLIVAHEVGHALGLRHNFKGSLSGGWDEAKGSSVMDYYPLPTRINADAIMNHVGAYDKVAIAYGYGFARPGETPKQLATRLSSDLEGLGLDFATDHDAREGPSPDWRANWFDSGSDPIRSAGLSLMQHHRSWARWAKSEAPNSVLRDALSVSLDSIVRDAHVIGKSLMGYESKRRGPTQTLAAVFPDDGTAQRAGLEHWARLLSDDTFDIPPELLLRAVPDESLRGTPETLLDPHGAARRALSLPLSALMSDTLAARSLALTPLSPKLMGYASLHRKASEMIWSRSERPHQLGAQIDHANALARALISPSLIAGKSATIHGEALWVRARLEELLAQPESKAKPELRAHWRQARDVINAALGARVDKTL